MVQIKQCKLSFLHKKYPATNFIFMRQVLKSGTVFYKLGTNRTNKALVEVTPVFPDVGELLIL